METTMNTPYKIGSRWIRHYHIPELNTRIPSITIMVFYDAYNMINEEHHMTVSWAICSPPDNFSRKIGRGIATEAKEYRGYQFVMPGGCKDHPIDFAVRYLLNSNIPSGDKDIKLLRASMEFYEEDENLVVIRRESKRFSGFHAAFKALKASLFNLKTKLAG